MSRPMRNWFSRKLKFSFQLDSNLVSRSRAWWRTIIWSDEPYMTVAFRKLTESYTMLVVLLNCFLSSPFRTLFMPCILICLFIQGKIWISLLWISLFTHTGFIGAYFSGIKRFNVTAGQAANIDAIIISYKCNNNKIYLWRICRMRLVLTIQEVRVANAYSGILKYTFCIFKGR